MRRAGWTVVLAGLVGCGGSSAAPVATTRPSDGAGPPVVAVTLTATGCHPQSFSLHPGQVIFQVTNPGVKTSEMEIQDANGHRVNDVEGVTKGRTRSFLVVLQAGATYRVRCPETQQPWGSITVTP